MALGSVDHSPTDCLPTLKRSSFKRKPETEEKTSDKLWEETVVKEQKCEGGGERLPEARSALPAGSQARIFITHARLVVGGLGWVGCVGSVGVGVGMVCGV